MTGLTVVVLQVVQEGILSCCSVEARASTGTAACMHAQVLWSDGCEHPRIFEMERRGKGSKGRQCNGVLNWASQGSRWWRQPLVCTVPDASTSLVLHAVVGGSAGAGQQGYLREPALLSTRSSICPVVLLGVGG